MHNQSRLHDDISLPEPGHTEFGESSQGVSLGEHPSQSYAIVSPFQEPSDLLGLPEPPIPDSFPRIPSSKRMKIVHEPSLQSFALSTMSEEHAEDSQPQIASDRMDGSPAVATRGERDRSEVASPSRNADLTQSRATAEEHICGDGDDRCDTVSLSSQPVSDLALVLAQNTLE